MDEVEKVGPGGSGEPVRIKGNKNRALQAVDPAGRRKLFDKARKRVFLEWFAGTANLCWSARMAGVHYRTVLRHRMEKPRFREQFDAALDQGMVRLRAWLIEAREAAGGGDPEDVAVAFDGAGAEGAERLYRDGDAGAEVGAGAEAAGAGPDPAPARLTPELAMQLLRDQEQRQARLARTDAGLGLRPGHGRRPRTATNEEVRTALVKRLRQFGIRVEGESKAAAAGGEAAAGAARAADGEGGAAPGPGATGGAEPGSGAPG